MGSLGRTVPLVQPGSGLGEKLARRGGGGGGRCFQGGGRGYGGEAKQPLQDSSGDSLLPRHA